MCDCHSILQCCIVFSGIKFTIRSFNLFQEVLNLHGKQSYYQKLGRLNFRAEQVVTFSMASENWLRLIFCRQPLHTQQDSYKEKQMNVCTTVKSIK